MTDKRTRYSIKKVTITIGNKHTVKAGKVYGVVLKTVCFKAVSLFCAPCIIVLYCSR